MQVVDISDGVDLVLLISTLSRPNNERMIANGDDYRPALCGN